MTTEVLSRRRAKTRERLMDAALVAFAERGVLGASVEEICEGADFSRGAFYSNFSSKDELCIALIDRECTRQIKVAEQALLAAQSGPDATDASTTIERTIATIVDVQEGDAHTTLAMAELRLHVVRNPAVRPAYRELEERIHSALIGLIADAAHRHGLRLCVDADLVLATLAGLFDAQMLAILVGSTTRDDLKPRMVAVLRRFLADDD